MAPEFGPQQVLGQVIWRLENARKPFSGRGSARTPRGGLTALPDPNWWGSWLPPPQEPHPRSWPFGPWTSVHWASPLTGNRRFGHSQYDGLDPPMPAASTVVL